MKNLAIATAALALGAGLSMTTAEAQTIRLGTEGAYPPYNFINDDGEIDGFERDLGDQLCERAALTCEWVTNDWDSIIPNLVSSNYDVIMAGMSITAERDEVIDFTQNYLPPDPSAFLALDGMDMADVAVIAAQTGTIQASHVTTMDGVQLVEFATPDETVAAVRNGEADAVLADKAFLTPIADEGADVVLIGEDVMLGGGIGLGLRESDTELKSTFDAVITEMKADGSLNALILEWFGENAQIF